MVRGCRHPDQPGDTVVWASVSLSPTSSVSLAKASGRTGFRLTAPGSWDGMGATLGAMSSVEARD